MADEINAAELADYALDAPLALGAHEQQDMSVVPCCGALGMFSLKITLQCCFEETLREKA